MIKFDDIQSINLEISTRCNAACPMCPRTAAGFETDLDYPVHDMTLEEVQKIFSVPFVMQLDYIHFGGNFGDFITARDGIDIVKYFTSINSKLKIIIHTNGSARPLSWWQELGSIPNVAVGFDLDGLEDTHSLYRRNTSWHTIIKNAQAFMSAGGTARWRFIEFDHNRHQITECRQLATKLGFASFEILAHGRTNGPVYHTKTGQFEYTIGDIGPVPADANEFRAVKRKIVSPEQRMEFYKTIPIADKINCEAKEKREIYITATGEVYPCCYLGHYPAIKDYTQWWQEDNFALYPMIHNNNALVYGLAGAINWFNKVEESWTKPSYSDGRLYKCDMFCGKQSPISITSTGL